MYTEYQPCRALSPYIDKYWEFQGNPGAGMRMHVMPDGCTDFIFTLGAATQAPGDELVMKPFRSYFIGPISVFSELETDSGTIHMLGVRFHPCGLFRFIDLPLNELTDKRVEAGDVTSFFSPSLPERLCEKKSPQERIGLIEDLLVRSLCRRTGSVDPQVVWAIGEINRFGGKLPVGELDSGIFVCRRHFERRFRTFTGFTPKEYSRIVRFGRVLNLLKTAASDDLLSVAVNAGYYDVPHLCREIKRLSGCTTRSCLSGFLPEGVSLICTKI